jgi:hypothetical protein
MSIFREESLVMFPKLDLACVREKAVEDNGAGIELDVIFSQEDFSG